MKFVSPDDTAVGKINDRITKKPEPAIRYAEILLIYAEALNELEDGSTYDISSWDGSTSYSISVTWREEGVESDLCRAVCLIMILLLYMGIRMNFVRS